MGKPRHGQLPVCVFFFKQKTEYEILYGLVGSEMCIRDVIWAAGGKVDDARLSALMQNPYFSRPPPKSLDRDAFDASIMAGCGLEDGAAILAAFTAHSVAAGTPAILTL